MDAIQPPGYPYVELTQAKATESVNQQESTPAPTPLPPSHPPLLGPENTVTICPHCRATIKTAVRFTTTSRTHIAAALCGMICCCCCIPYCSESAKNSDHFCPNCDRYLGTYKK